MKTSSQVARDFLQATNMQSQLGAPASHQHVCTGYAVATMFFCCCCCLLFSAHCCCYYCSCCCCCCTLRHTACRKVIGFAGSILYEDK